MKTKILNYRKTDHFLYRQWDRGIDSRIIESITSNINGVFKDKTLLVIGKSDLKKFGLKSASNLHLVLVIKRNILITLYYVKDLYPYLKTLPKNTRVLTF